MPRSSRHKSSKHSSRETREYSDSEKESGLKDRKGKEESVARLKESGSSEKRKLDSKDKDSYVSVNGEYLEEFSSSKRRKERVDDGVNDRWNGGDDDRGESTKKLKDKSGESKSKRRDDSLGLYGDGEESTKKSSAKGEGKHRESSSRKEGRESEREKDRDRERERKGKEGRSEKWVDVDDQRSVKQVSEKTESNIDNLLRSPDSDGQHDRRNRKKRDDSGDGDKHQDNIGDINDRRLSSRDDVGKDGRSKDDKHKDERHRDKYHDDIDKENRYREEKQRDERASRDHTNNRSDEKNIRDDKNSVEIRQKKSKTQDGDYDREFDSSRDRDRDVEREYYHRERDRDRDRDRDKDRDRERDRDREYDQIYDRDWDLERDRERDRDQDRDRDRDHRERERDRDYDRAQMDDRSARYKDSRGKKRSPDDLDDYDDGKSRGTKMYPDNEKKSLSSNKAESDVDRGRSQSRQSHIDVSNNRRRTSPNTSSHGAADEYRSSKATSSREVTGFSGSSERGSKYRSSEKPIRMEDGNVGELPLERSSSSKASPKGFADRSPSTSLERRYLNRTGVRWNLDIEDSGRRSSAPLGARDLPSTEDRPSRELPLDESVPSDSSFHNRMGQGNTALNPPHGFRGGLGSPSFLGSVEEDGRINSGARYKRSGDPLSGRGQGNAWRGAQNWSSPMPNGYIPFQHGPPHGGFQAMMPQFPSPPLFGVRPPMDMNHSGIPYHIPDADRFSGHMRPLGWQSMMDGSGGPSHMHGWDGNNGVFRDELLYGGPEWDQSRHSMNGRGWETGADMWKGQNGDLPSTPIKEDATAHAPVDDLLPGHTVQLSQSERYHGVQAKSTEKKPAVDSSTKESSKLPPKTGLVKVSEPTTMLSGDDATHLCGAYLARVDVSAELTSPDLYRQCMSLLNAEQNATEDEDTDILVNLKDHARAVPKSSKTILSNFLPATSNSIFQRAMNLYKKQSVHVNSLPTVNGRIIDVILASKEEDESPISDVDKVAEPEEPILRCDAEIPDTAKVAEVFSSTAAPDEKQGEAGNHADTCEPNLELLDRSSSHGSLKATTQVDSCDDNNKIEELPKQVTSENEEEDDITNAAAAANVLPQTASNLPANANNIGEVNENDTLGEESEGGAIRGALIFSDDLTQASTTSMMPGTNDSESVILSRIHHSPESTH